MATQNSRIERLEARRRRTEAHQTIDVLIPGQEPGTWLRNGGEVVTEAQLELEDAKWRATGGRVRSVEIGGPRYLVIDR